MERVLEKWRERIGGASEKQRYYAIYTLCFLAVSLGVYIWFLCGSRTFIWHADGWNEYYKALVYYAQYLRSIIRSIIVEKNFMVPNWDFSLGEGGDVLQVLHCFGIGDPIVALSVFIPADYLHLFYTISTLLRLYLAGIVFSALCFKSGIQNRHAVLAGTMAYVFSHWAVFNSSVHPFFITPMICLPLLILGVEKIIQKESPLFFTVSVFLAGICNFYFFYILVLLTVIYVFVRIFYVYKREIKKGIAAFWNIGWSALLGAGLAAVILAPVCYTFLDNDRVGGASNFRNLFYPLSYYSQLPGLYFSKENVYGLHMGFAVPVFFAACLLFKKKKEHRFLKILFLINILFMVVPAFGQVLNGFSYMSNRWCFAFTLLSAYILAVMWPSLMKVNEKERNFLFGCITVYAAICMLLEYSRTIYVFTAVVLCYILLFFIMPEEAGKGKWIWHHKNAAAFTVLFVSIFMLSFWRNSSAVNASNTASEGVEAKDAAYRVLKMNEASAIKDYAELNGTQKGFYRYSGRNLTKNAGQLSALSSTQFYYSFANPYIVKYRNEMELLETGQTFSYEGYDDRPFLMSLASVLYYAAPFQNTGQIPYGMRNVWSTDVRDMLVQTARNSLMEELGQEELSERQEYEIRSAASSWWSIYQNDYFLPVAYTYDSYVPENVWDNLSAVEKQEAMLQTVRLEEKPRLLGESIPNLTSTKIPYSIICNSDDVSVQDNLFIVTAPNASVTLTLDGLANCETYFSIKGLEFDGVSDYELYFGDDSVDPYNIYTQTSWNLLSYDRQKNIKKEKLFWSEPEDTTLSLSTSTGVYNSVNYKTPDYIWYSDHHNFTAKLGYSEEGVKTITISFEKKGRYQYDNIEILCQPMDEYGNRIEALKKDTFDNVVVGNDKVSGTLNVDSPKILCFSIPYSDGWKAYVDGKESKIYHANTAYMAVEVDAGEHTYELLYETPFLKVGAFISFISFVILCTIYIIRKGSKRL